jgi:hypothetical protein
MPGIDAPSIDRPIDDSPVGKIRRVLEAQGVLAALRVLNGRAPHRYTGIYKYDPVILRNIYLVDAFDPTVTRGTDVPNEDAYCVLLADQREFAFGRPQDAPCPAKLASPVASYCGVLLVRSNGTPFGSLCHFDVARCEEPATQMPQLVAIAPHIMATLEAEGH